MDQSMLDFFAPLLPFLTLFREVTHDASVLHLLINRLALGLRVPNLGSTLDTTLIGSLVTVASFLTRLLLFLSPAYLDLRVRISPNPH